MVLWWEKVDFQLEQNSSSNHFQMTVLPLSSNPELWRCSKYI